MNNNLIIVAIVGILIIIGGIWYYQSGSSAPVTDGTETMPTTETDGVALVPDKGSGTLKTVLAKGGNYTCTLEFAEAKEKSTATIYGASGKVREDFRATDNTDGTFTDTHVIKTGGVVYTWVDGNVVGLKSYGTGPVLPVVKGVGFTTTPEASVSWDCHAWLPDQKQFALPKEISFVNE